MLSTLPNVLESLTLINDSIVEVRYKYKVNVDENDMRQILDALYNLTNGKRLKRLIVISKGSSLSLKARLLLQEENKDRKEEIVAEAVVVNSLTQKMTTNFYLKFIKDIYPSKFFTDYEKALQWLKDQ